MLIILREGGGWIVGGGPRVGFIWGDPLPLLNGSSQMLGRYDDAPIVETPKTNLQVSVDREKW